MELVSYAVAAAVVAFGIFVVRRLILSWRRTFRPDEGDGAGGVGRSGEEPGGGAPSG
ncbi:MAG TPA: hypothetical protein VFI59_16525 [Actinomycetota bacterium]|nr:hypothetical protein [Actinomycetota bacterium]